jgi:hypothetical protein
MRIQYGRMLDAGFSVLMPVLLGYGLGDRGIGVRVLGGARIFSTASKVALGPTSLSNGYWG